MKSISNPELAKCPPVKGGDEIMCPKCGDIHVLEDSDPPFLLFFQCKGKTYLAGIQGRLTMGRKR